MGEYPPSFSLSSPAIHWTPCHELSLSWNIPPYLEQTAELTGRILLDKWRWKIFAHRLNMILFDSNSLQIVSSSELAMIFWLRPYFGDDLRNKEKVQPSLVQLCRNDGTRGHFSPIYCSSWVVHHQLLWLLPCNGIGGNSSDGRNRDQNEKKKKKLLTEWLSPFPASPFHSIQLPFDTLQWKRVELRVEKRERMGIVAKGGRQNNTSNGREKRHFHPHDHHVGKSKEK